MLRTLSFACYRLAPRLTLVSMTGTVLLLAVWSFFCPPNALARTEKAFLVAFAIEFLVGFALLGLSGVLGVLDCCRTEHKESRQRNLLQETFLAAFGFYGAASVGYVLVARIL